MESPGGSRTHSCIRIFFLPNPRALVMFASMGDKQSTKRGEDGAETNSDAFSLFVCANCGYTSSEHMADKRCPICGTGTSDSLFREIGSHIYTLSRTSAIAASLWSGILGMGGTILRPSTSNRSNPLRYLCDILRENANLVSFYSVILILLVLLTYRRGRHDRIVWGCLIANILVILLIELTVMA